MTVNSEHIDRLLDAIDLVKTDRRKEAQNLLRELIRENNDFEDAWLWMSVAVDTLDQSTICLDNVLRLNPNNMFAAGALYRLRESEMRMEKRRSRYRFYRDLSLVLLWMLMIGTLFAILFTYPMMVAG
jgi:hypothetical protein